MCIIGKKSFVSLMHCRRSGARSRVSSAMYDKLKDRIGQHPEMNSHNWHVHGGDENHSMQMGRFCHRAATPVLPKLI
jgi:hypothetical protein